MQEGDACRLPAFVQQDEQSAHRRMLLGRRIAVVGLSSDPSKASFGVAEYLKSAGFEVIPVNPNYTELMGVRCYPNLLAVPGPIDVVDVFRRPEFCADVVREAIAAGAKGVWLQSGIVSDQARELALSAGLDYVEDRCLKVDHLMNR